MSDLLFYVRHCTSAAVELKSQPKRLRPPDGHLKAANKNKKTNTPTTHSAAIRCRLIMDTFNQRGRHPDWLLQLCIGLKIPTYIIVDCRRSEVAKCSSSLRSYCVRKRNLAQNNMGRNTRWYH